MFLIVNILLYAIFFFFFNDTATTEIYTLSLHDALPILADDVRRVDPERARERHKPREAQRVQEVAPGEDHERRRVLRAGFDHVRLTEARADHTGLATRPEPRQRILVEIRELRLALRAAVDGVAAHGISPEMPRGVALPAVPLQQDHHDDAGEDQVLLHLREFLELLQPEAALEDGPLLRHAQGRASAQVHDVGRVEEEAAQGVAERYGLHQAVEHLHPRVLLVDGADRAPRTVREGVGALPEGTHPLLADGPELRPVGEVHGVARAEVEHPVGLYAEEELLLVLVGVDAHVLLEPELLFADVGDQPAAGVGDTNAGADGRYLEPEVERVTHHAPRSPSRSPHACA